MSQTTRIPIDVNRVITAVLFGIAILTFSTRCYIRFALLKQFAVEDGFLILAACSLIATTVFSYIDLSNLYSALLVVLGSSDTTNLFNVLALIETSTKISEALSTLWWLVLFPVKLAYLFFFRKLIDRLPRLKIYWWFMISFIILSLAVCIAMAFVSCTATQVVEIIEKCSGPAADNLQAKLVTVTTSLDVITDILIASFPVLLLWPVKISTRQKVGLGTVLSLSFVMATMAVVRIAGMRLEAGGLDIVWLAFWGQQECSIALIMVSITAFRSFFVANNQNRDRSPRYTSTYWRNRLLRKNQSSDTDEVNLDVEITSATLTDMQTVIQGLGSARLTSQLAPNDNDEEALRLNNKERQRTATALEVGYPPHAYVPLDSPTRRTARDGYESRSKLA